MPRRGPVLTVLAVAVAFSAAPLFGRAHALAQGLQELVPISFGHLVVPDNSVTSTVTVPRNGTVTTSGPIIAIAQGQPGQYQVSGYPGNMTLDITVHATPLFADGVPASQFFTITAFDHPATVVTNSAGTATFRLGATLSTSGSGAPYTDVEYVADLTLTLAAP